MSARRLKAILDAEYQRGREAVYYELRTTTHNTPGVRPNSFTNELHRHHGISRHCEWAFRCGVDDARQEIASLRGVS